MDSQMTDQTRTDAIVQRSNQNRFLQERKLAQEKKLIPNNVPDEFRYLVDQKKTWKSDDLSFNNQMQRFVASSFKSDDVRTQQDFSEVILERGSVPSSKLTAISKDKILEAVGELIQITGVTQTTATGVGNGVGVRLTSTISDNKDPNRIMFAIPEMTAYQNSVSGTTVIPYGSDTINSGYKLHLAPDLRDNQAADVADRGHTWIYSIYNGTGGSKDIIFRTRYRYIGRDTAS